MGVTTAQAKKLFKNVPEKDILNFYKGEIPQYHRPVDFLHFRKDEVAAATGTPKKSVRYDGKIPKILSKRLTEWATAINLVASHFNDIDKTKLWFQTPNPILGNASPRELIILGRFKKLYQFIVTAIDENSV